MVIDLPPGTVITSRRRINAPKGSLVLLTSISSRIAKL